MSKSKLKKQLSELSKEDLIELILNSYDANRETKEFYEFFLNPDEESLIEKIKKIIINEFYPVRLHLPKLRYSVIHRAIKHFQKLGASDNAIIELYIFYILIGSDYLTQDLYTTQRLPSNIVETRKMLDKIIADAGLCDIYKPELERLDKKVAKVYGYI